MRVRQDTSGLTLVHVSGEAGEDSTQRCGVEEAHGAEEELAEQLVVEDGGCSHGALAGRNTGGLNEETNKQTQQNNHNIGKQNRPEGASRKKRTLTDAKNGINKYWHLGSVTSVHSYVHIVTLT